jgi:WD40 repeat protein
MPPTISCIFCGSDNQPRARYCRSCGQLLQTSKYHSTTGHLLTNIMLKQRYRVVEPVGQGGFGVVYRAEDTQLGNRQIAIKEMSQSGLSFQDQKEAADAFRQEAIILARLQHPNLPSIFDHFEENQRWYLVMSFIEGETLEDYIYTQSERKLPLSDAIDIGVQLCTVLDYLHNQQPPIIFRDLKPTNIMRAPDGHIYLIDFGIARHFKQGQAKDTSALGSPGYAAPEQHGKKQTTPHSDIYSLGAILYQLISGHDPATSPFRFPPLQSLAPAVPAGLATFITQMLDMDEGKRPANMLAIKQALQPLTPYPQPLLPSQPKSSLAQPPRPKFYPLKPPQPQGTLLFLYTNQSIPTMSADRWSATFLSKVLQDSQLEEDIWPQSSRLPATRRGRIPSLAVWSPDSTRIAFTSEYRASKKNESAPLLPRVSARPTRRSSQLQPVPPAFNGRIVQVWSADGREEPFFYYGDTVLWLPDGTVRANYTGRFRSVASSNKSLSLKGKEIYSPDGISIASVADDGTVQVRNMYNMWQPFIYKEHIPLWSSLLREKPSSVLAVVWSPDSTRIASAYESGTVQIWNVDGSGHPFICKGRSSLVSIKWSPHGTHIALSYSERIVQVYTTDGSGQSFIYEGSSVEWSSDERQIASILRNGTVIVGNVDGSRQPFTYRGHSLGRRSRVRSLAWSSDGKRIASTSDDTVHIWNVDGSGHPFIYKGHSSSVSAAPGHGQFFVVLGMAWSPDDKRIISAASDNTVQVWNTDGSGQPSIYTGYSYSSSVLGVEWSPDGKRIACFLENEIVLVWSADAHWQPPFMYTGHSGLIWSLAWSPDGTRIASASHDGTLHIWDADRNEQISIYKNHTDVVTSVAWSPDGARFATASRDKTVLVGNADGSGKSFIHRGHQGAVLAVAWSPDGMRVASASQDGAVQIWNRDGSGQPFIYTDHKEAVVSVAWSPDGRRIVSASSAKEDAVHVWNADGSDQPFIYEGHNYFAWTVIVTAVAWSPDGRRIASSTLGDPDAPNFISKTVHVWNADGSGQPFIYEGHKDGVLSVEWSPDGTRIVSTSKDGVVQIWSAG